MRSLVAAFVLAVLTCTAAAQTSGVLGYWKEPSGSILHVERCGEEICATLVAIGPSAPSRVDGRNPDHALRQRSLCDLRIGTGFHLSSPEKAEGGTLYDPKSGKTYRGSMTSEGDRLNLRGYVGLPLFGRSETWTRTGPVSACRG